MKRIKVLTFSGSINYGATLQAYALKRFLIDSGYDCSLIYYQNHNNKYAQVTGLRKTLSIIWNNTLANFLDSSLRKKRTAKFRAKYLELGDLITSDNLKKLCALNASTDVFIVGSDQVWNPEIIRDDPVYFLSFVADDKKRISYAASFGTGNVSESYLKDKLKYLSAFHALSVRESQSADLIREKLCISAKTVIDPVFLLKKEEWVNALNLNKNTTNLKEPSGYVLCYVMPINDELTRKIFLIAKTIAEISGLKVITLGKKSYTLPFKGEVIDKDAGSIEFLQYIKNADYVVTNSFHGTALSVVFRKNFYTILKKGIKRNSRMEELLNAISLSERIIYTDYEPKMDMFSEIDYTKVTQKLDEQIEYAKQFLIQAIEE